jgi:glyoxylase-like metal-dependent hydrolase (beta-lactamase superfamily II)
MDYIKICDKIYLVGRGIWGGLVLMTAKFDCNIYLVDGGNELALIDNGEALNIVKLRKNIISAGMDFNKINKLIITHDHVDHTANTWLLKKILKAEVFSGRGSCFFLKPDQYVKTGSIIKVGDISLKVYNTPGHTPDSLCLEAKINEKRVLFSGDTAIGDQPKNGKGVVGWYNVKWGSDIKKFVKSVRFIKKLDPDIMLPGHGLPHLTKRKCREALKNCEKRLADFGKYPELESMFPHAFDRSGISRSFDLKGNKQLFINVKIRREIKR